jgi:hypothetical protein
MSKFICKVAPYVTLYPPAAGPKNDSLRKTLPSIRFVRATACPMGLGRYCRGTTPFYGWKLAGILFLQYLRYVAGLPEEPVPGTVRVRRQGAAELGALSRLAPKSRASRGSNVYLQSNQAPASANIPPASSPGGSHHHQQARAGDTNQPSGGSGANTAPMDCDSTPPASAEGLSSSKIPAGFDKMGPQYKAVSEVSGKHKNQIWTVFSDNGQRRASFVV